MIFAVLLSACGKTAKAPAADTPTAEAPVAATTGSTMQNALPDSMENGEVVLGGATNEEAHFEGSVPKEKISVEPGMAARLLIPGTDVDTRVQTAKAGCRPQRRNTRFTLTLRTAPGSMTPIRCCMGRQIQTMLPFMDFLPTAIPPFSRSIRIFTSICRIKQSFFQLSARTSRKSFPSVTCRL